MDDTRFFSCLFTRIRTGPALAGQLRTAGRFNGKAFPDVTKVSKLHAAALGGARFVYLPAWCASSGAKAAGPTRERNHPFVL